MITVWADAATAPVLQAAAADFTAQTGTVVDVVELTLPAIRSQVLSAAEDGEGPDLFVGAHAWTGELRDAGAVRAILGLPPEQREAFAQPALEAFRVDGIFYGIPYAAETIALWTNVDLAGPTAPADFDGLLDLCDGLSIDVVCLAVAGGGGVPDAYYQNPFLTGFGGSVFRYQPSFGYVADRAGIDEPESIAASTFLAALDRGVYLPPLDYVTAKQRFVEGEVAYWLTGYWEAEAIAEAASNRGFSTTAIPVPSITGIPARPFIDAVGIFLGTTASADARGFLTDWLATDEGMLALAPDPPLFPAHREPIAQVTDPTERAFLQSMEIAVPTPNIVEMSDEIWEIWGGALSEIRDDGTDPETALTAAAAEIRRILGLPEPEPEPTDEG
jgi:arabinogalactan oligomer/maltooligosaccharide transport system substrate-binding protein